MAGGGVVGYAWYDSSFRDLIGSYVPYSKDAIDFTLQKLPSPEDVL